MFDRAKNFVKKAKKFDDENQQAKRNAPLWLVILNDGIPVFTIIAFVVLGAVWGLWHPGWLVFFIIPIYYSLVEAVKHKNANFFAFPFLALGVFLAVGFARPDMWHPIWAVLISIPAYYLIVGIISAKRLKPIVDVLVPVVSAVAYVAIGFATGKWHPGWVVFLAIPLYFTISASVQKYNRRIRAQNAADRIPSPSGNAERKVERKDDDDVFIK